MLKDQNGESQTFSEGEEWSTENSIHTYQIRWPVGTYVRPRSPPSPAVQQESYPVLCHNTLLQLNSFRPQVTICYIHHLSFHLIGTTHLACNMYSSPTERPPVERNEWAIGCIPTKTQTKSWPMITNWLHSTGLKTCRKVRARHHPVKANVTGRYNRQIVHTRRLSCRQTSGGRSLWHL